MLAPPAMLDKHRACTVHVDEFQRHAAIIPSARPAGVRTASGREGVPIPPMTSSPRVVLYNPASNASGKRILPMSLLALGAVIEGRYDYRIVDGNREARVLDRLRDAIREGADVLGVTVMPGPQLAAALPHCRALKREFPSLRVVWGGYFPTQHADVVLRDPAVDFVVRGHGELVFLSLLDALAAGGEVTDLAGLACRDADGQIVTGTLAPIPHPDRLPEYPYHRLPMADYVRPTFLGTRTLGHHASYGCPFRCNFCAVVNMVDGRWLPQSAARVSSVVERYVREWGVDAVEFCDNNFFVHEGRLNEIATRLTPLGIAWWGEARIDTLLQFSEATWRALSESGLRMVFMGAESGSAGVLRRMDKGGTVSPEQTLEIAGKTKAFGIVPEFSFVLGHPPDPDSDVRQTLAFIRRVKRVNPAAEIILYHYTPVPLDGDLYAAARASGFAFPETLDEWVDERWLAFSQRYSTVMPWLSTATSRRIRNFQRVINAYYPTITDARLTRGRRRVLRGASAWRYHTGFYQWPLELRALQRAFRYQRPETSGF